ncbi:MAG: LacI family DNA-binding transcriptional regulator [Betaproteobacteria bacterium]|nr:LacI family DNA-binding transcriptional regulator [Betaproteobacteria bacterium]
MPQRKISNRLQNTDTGIRDVARRAGVSTASVSRAVNRPETVSPEIRAKVERAVRQLGYVPNAGARALTLNRSHTLGAVIPTIDNAIFAKGIEALQKHLARFKYHVLLATSGYDPERESEQAVNLAARGVDGLIFMGESHTDDLKRFLARREIPYVNTGTYDARSAAACVGFDNAEAIERAIRFLLDLGHRRIAMLAGITRDNDRMIERVRGVRRALRAAGLDLPRERLAERSFDVGEAREGLRALMAAAPAPTAVVCANDVLAHGALIEAAALGVRVPEALSIVGFDDLEIARHLRPSLTTVHVPTEEMWQRAADYLLATIEGRTAKRHTRIEVTLVVRESTGPAPGRD